MFWPKLVRDARAVVKLVGGMLVIVSLFVAAPNTVAQAGPREPPKSWVDSVTGHRIIRLTDEPGSYSLYFNEAAFTPDGLDMIYVTLNGVHVLNLATHQSRILIQGHPRKILVGTKTRRVFFETRLNYHLYVADIDTGGITDLAVLPTRALISSFNADETVIAGTLVEGNAPDLDHYKAQATNDAKEEFAEARAKHEDNARVWAKVNAQAQEQRFAAHSPEDLFVTDLRTGQSKIILSGHDWLNHVLFSPSDPGLLMYCHEGPTLEVDRIWTIHTDGSNNQLIHKRGAKYERAVHEFWSHDGKTIWYDLQKPVKGKNYLAGYNVADGKRVWYELDELRSPRHYNSSSDDRLFIGDGDDKFPNEDHYKMIELFHPNLDPSAASEGDHQIGTLISEKLVDLSKHNYMLEPNARFSPDNKFVIFTSNMFGPTYIFAVEVESSSQQ